MARLRMAVVALETDGDAYAGATVKFYQPGTASLATSTTTTGTPFSGSIYATITGGSPISTTGTLNSSGTLVVWTGTKSRYDAGVEPAGGGTAFIRQYETMEIDPADVLTLLDAQLVLPPGTLAAPSVAWASDLDTGFGVDSAGEPFISKDGIGILEVDGATTYLRSPDGTDAITLTDAGVTTAPGILRGLGVYNVADHGLVAGSSSGLAAANTTALAALYLAVATAGGGVIAFPPAGVWSLNATTLTHALGIGVSVNLEGSGRNATVLKFYGSTGPFLNFAPSSGSVQRWHMQGFLIQHESVSTGAALAFSGAISKVDLIDVEIASGGFLVGISTAHATEMVLERCKINTRTDYADLVSGGLTPVALDIVNSAGMGGLYIHHTELGTIQKGANPASRGIIVRFNNAGPVDTVVFGEGTHLIGGDIGILKNGGVGNVSNVLVGNAFITDVDICVQGEPPTGATVENWQFNGTWMAAYERNMLFGLSNGGTAQHFGMSSCYLTDATVSAISFGPGVNGVALSNIQVYSSVNTGGLQGVTIGDNSTASRDISIVGGVIAVGASADSAYLIGSAVDNVTVAYVTTRGKVGAITGALDASRVHVAGAFLA